MGTLQRALAASCSAPACLPGPGCRARPTGMVKRGQNASHLQPQAYKSPASVRGEVLHTTAGLRKQGQTGRGPECCCTPHLACQGPRPSPPSPERARAVPLCAQHIHLYARLTRIRCTPAGAKGPGGSMQATLPPVATPSSPVRITMLRHNPAERLPPHQAQAQLHAGYRVTNYNRK